MKVEEEGEEIDHARADDDGGSEDVGECDWPLGARGKGFRGAVRSARPTPCIRYRRAGNRISRLVRWTRLGTEIF